MFGWDQKERLLRENWTADNLAQEIYAMFGSSVPANTSGTVSMPSPLTIGNYKDGSPIFSFSGPGTSNQTNVGLVNGIWQFTDANGNIISPPPSSGSTPVPTMITLTGDVTGSGTTTIATTISANSVSYSKMQQVSAHRLLGNSSGSSANVSEISLGTGLSFSGSTITCTVTGTVTSVAISGGTTGLTVSGSPVTTSGTITISGDLVVANGGTGNTTFTAYSVICAGTTATGAFQNVSGLGTSGQVLTSNGAGALPTWQASSGGGGGADGASFTTPSLGTWTLSDPSSMGATLTTAGNSVALYSPSNTGDHYAMALKSLPATPYSCIFHIKSFIPGANFGEVGVLWRDSVHNFVKTLSNVYNSGLSGTEIQAGYGTDGTAHTVTSNVFQFHTKPWGWFKLSDDGTTQTYWVSPDGTTWIKIYSEASNTNVTPNQVGFHVNPRNASGWPALAALWSYQETSP